MECEDIFRAVVGFMWLIYIWETYLSYRQRQVIRRSTSVPREIEQSLSTETFEKARAYQLDKSVFGFWSGLYTQVETTLILCYNILPLAWNLAGKLLERNGYDSSYEILQSLVFILIFLVYSTISSLPWGLYSTFVIEARHGFNKQTLGFYFKDLIKKLVVGVCLSLPITAGLLWVIKWGGEYFFIYVWLFMLCISLIFITIYADFIAPLFDRFTALPQGELRFQIEELAASIRFPLTKIYIVEGSKRSSHSNAYFYGFFNNKRIVLFDTLLKDSVIDADESTESTEAADTEEAEQSEETPKKKHGCSNEEILAILSHELGHWKLSHNLQNFILGQINTFVSFLVFGFLMDRTDLYEAFGFDTKPTIIGLIIIFQFIFSPYNELLSFFMTVNTRRFEFEADAFARKLHKADMLKAALLKLNEDNLSFPYCDWLYSTWTYSHPPLLERLAALDAKKKDD